MAVITFSFDDGDIQLNIVVMGAGALGSLFGGLLSRDNQVTLIGREPHMKKIARDGLKITGLTQETVFPETSTSPADIPNPDLLIITVKAYDTKRVMKTLPQLGSNTLVMSLQNGLGNINAIAEYVPKDRIIAGLTSHGSTFIEPGVIRHGGVGDTIIGRVEGANDDRISEIASIFTEAGIKTRVSDNMAGEIWAKVIINSAINPLTAILGKENGALLEDPTLIEKMKEVVSEGIRVARTHKVLLPDYDIFEKTLEVARMTAGNRSSMLQDIENGRMTEIESINGMIEKMARLAYIEAPANLELTVKIREIQKP